MTPERLQEIRGLLLGRNVAVPGINDQLLVNELIENFSTLLDAQPKCAICDKPASCIGSYEGPHDAWDFACDSCCGHGCEDGQCYPIAEIPATWRKLIEWCDFHEDRECTLENALRDILAEAGHGYIPAAMRLDAVVEAATAALNAPMAAPTPRAALARKLDEANALLAEVVRTPPRAIDDIRVLRSKIADALGICRACVDALKKGPA